MEYQDLLKRALEKLPKKTETTSRFVAPTVDAELSGSKTVLRNFSEIAVALRRDASHLSKFLFKELATAGSIQGSSLIFNGKISREMLQRKLEAYIKEFLYCKECKEPDTRLAKEGRITFMICEACGAKHPVRSI